MNAPTALVVGALSVVALWILVTAVRDLWRDLFPNAELARILRGRS